MPRAVAQVRAVHDRVVGVTVDGVPYAANDPHLLKWVHVAELDSFLTGDDRGKAMLDIAGTVLFLCSDDAAYITGVALPVDGGATAAMPASAFRAGARSSYSKPPITPG